MPDLHQASPHSSSSGSPELDVRLKEIIEDGDSVIGCKQPQESPESHHDREDDNPNMGKPTGMEIQIANISLLHFNRIDSFGKLMELLDQANDFRAVGTDMLSAVGTLVFTNSAMLLTGIGWRCLIEQLKHSLLKVNGINTDGSLCECWIGRHCQRRVEREGVVWMVFREDVTRQSCASPGQ
jgi:hypothetical protein